MARLPSFSLPPVTPEQATGVPFERELSPTLAVKWNTRVSAIFDEFRPPNTTDFPNFYNPTVDDIPSDASPAPVTWEAFPATLVKQLLPDEVRWQIADDARKEQDEYCEWSVLKPENKIVRVTFTCELPEYWEHLAAEDEELLLALYQKYVSSDVRLEQLKPNGKYRRRNQWNNSTEGSLMHLMHGVNTLGDAVGLTAQASVLREDDGKRVTERHELVDCGGFGSKFRGSDPQIAEKVNQAAAEKKRVTLADPVGLYIADLLTAGMEFPKGLTAEDCWHIERGDRDHILRARFELPGSDKTVEDVKVDGRPITRGGQLADRVLVKITALADGKGTITPVVKQCGE